MKSHALKAPPLIYSWTGAELPASYHKPIEFAIASNPALQIIVLTDQKIKLPRGISDRITVHKIDLEHHERLEYLPVDPFWRNTALRFSVLADFAHKQGIKAFFHAEFDNLVFSLDALSSRLDSIGIGLFVPRDSLHRAIASFIYVNNPSLLYRVFDFFLPPYNASNEMEALGFLAENCSSFYSLPTESHAQSRQLWKQISPSHAGGIFDAAAIGQYILGVDPRNQPLYVKRNGFINENCLVDWSRLHVIAGRNSLSIYDFTSMRVCKCFNLHVHSKDFELALRVVNGKSGLVDRLNRGQRSIVGDRELLLIGPFLRFSIRLLRWVRRHLRFFNQSISSLEQK